MIVGQVKLSCSTPDPFQPVFKKCPNTWAVCSCRCASPRGYRVPPCALINLSHGTRIDSNSHKLTAIVKPQPAASVGFNSHRQLAGLNHSPRSPFIPTQVSEGKMRTKAVGKGFHSYTFSSHHSSSSVCVCSTITSMSG